MADPGDTREGETAASREPQPKEKKRNEDVRNRQRTLPRGATFSLFVVVINVAGHVNAAIFYGYKRIQLEAMLSSAIESCG